MWGTLPEHPRGRCSPGCSGLAVRAALHTALPDAPSDRLVKVAQHVSDSVVQVFWKTEGDGKQNLTPLEMSVSGYFVLLSLLDMHSVWALLEQHGIPLLRFSSHVRPHGSAMCYVRDKTVVA